MTQQQDLYMNTKTGELAFGTDIAAENVGPRPVLSEEQLLEQLVRLNKEINARKEDIKQLIKDSKFHKKENPGGLPADVCKKTAKTAVRYAKSDYEEVKLETLEFFAFYERAVGYDD